MPQILVVTDTRDETAGDVVYSERVALTDLESDHFSGQLVERVGWAVHDADQMEHRSELAARAAAYAKAAGAGSTQRRSVASSTA
jgi:hypothetical protein